MFWWSSLEKHNKEIAKKDRMILSWAAQHTNDTASIVKEFHAIEKSEELRTKQYMGEGFTFLIVTLVGAVVVYSSFRKSVQLSKQQNNFMLAITHELKTPIAGIKLGLQTMQKHNLEEKQKEQILKRGITEADRLDELCSNILFAAQLEGRQYQLVSEPVDFSELVYHRESVYNSLSKNGVTFQCEPSIMVKGDKVMLNMLINNLISNAIKYAGDYGPIEVIVAKHQQSVLFQVKDLGPGVPDAEKQKIFNKFYRIGDENTRKKKGSGLGLYLTKAIVKSHMGSIKLLDNIPKGTIAEVRLPLYQA